jgi:hypothetical protein
METTPLLRNLEPEDRLLLTCARPELTSAHIEQVQAICEQSSIDWKRVYLTSQYHQIAPLVFENLKLAGMVPAMPPQPRLQFGTSTERTKIWKTLLSARLIRILQFFSARKLDVMLLKGAALDLLIYQERWHTISDTDLVLRCKKTEMPETEATAIWGFLNKLEPKSPLVEVELFDHHDVTMNGVLAVDFAAIWAAAQTIAIDGYPVFVMSPEDSLICSCINACRKRYFRLKSLSDVAGILGCYRNLDWDAVVQSSRQSECSAICYTALTIVQQTLGWRLPDGILRKLGLGRWKTATIDHLVSRLSYSSLASLREGVWLCGRSVGPSMLLPLASYTWPQIGRKCAMLHR